MSLGLFGTLGVAARALQTQQQGIEVAGHNLANAANPAYARQRIIIQTSQSVPSSIGPQGTGAEAIAIQQIRNFLIDEQLASELSVGGYWTAQQQGLEYARAALGQEIDLRASGAEGAAAASGTAGEGIAEALSDLFNAFQSLSTNPTSLAERQVLLQKAQNLASQFNQVDGRLGNVRNALNAALQSDVASANELLAEIAGLNDKIITVELTSTGVANDLRDLRQQKIEELSRLVAIDTSVQPNGAINVSIAGTLVVSNEDVLDTLEAYDAGGGQFLVRTQTGGTPLTLTGGSIQGTIDARDGALAALSTSINSLATLLISEVNTIHSAGFSLTGSTGASFFTGTNAGTIAVNAALLSDPSLIQASGTSGAVGDNQVALALAQLADQTFAAVGNQTFGQSYAQTVSAFGQSLSSANQQIADQQIVENMLRRQRDSVSGVSIDEEMTDLMKYQRAFEASARLVTVIDEMLETLVNMAR
jgi:flagellar hook-associated protein 1 FlgK